ncbi:hypothetical protein E2C01_033470 [Portunus trituberculatus]|uniref:Uncharacterized protein n=1 Tax=Portunus trituberculatus TaxID=210409 RepID=A0A5B7F3U2_PORTR|nr:hypothetical protein [Portunus trituberculatus]
MRSISKLTPGQVEEVKKPLMEHEDVVSQDIFDLSYILLVQHSINNGQSSGEELLQTAPETVVTLQWRMEATQQQVSGSLCIMGQALCTSDAWHSVGDCVSFYNLWKKRGLTLEVQSDWEGPCIILQCLSAVKYQLSDDTERCPHIVHIDRLWVMSPLGSKQKNDSEKSENEEETAVVDRVCVLAVAEAEKTQQGRCNSWCQKCEM